MVLIIFYLMVGSFVSIDYEDLRLPLAVEGEDVSGGEVFTVNVAMRPSAAGVDRPTMIVSGRVVNAAELSEELRYRLSREPDTVVQLRAERDLPYGAVEPAVRACSRAGARTLRLVTESAR